MRLITTAILCLVLLINIDAQEVISNAGNSFSNNNLEISWTLGETIIKTEQSSENQITQGFHQSKIVVTAIEANFQSICNINVFPNPTSDFLNLNFDKEVESNLRFSLINSEGRILVNKQIEAKQTQIKMHHYTTGIYFLQVRENNDVIKAFKIVKN